MIRRILVKIDADCPLAAKTNDDVLAIAFDRRELDPLDEEGLDVVDDRGVA